MITCNGIVGISLPVASLRHGTAVFNPEGTGAALATAATLATLSLVLPTFTTSKAGPEFSPAQLTFAAVSSLILYGLFVASLSLLGLALIGVVGLASQGRLADHRGSGWSRPAFRTLSSA